MILYHSGTGSLQEVVVLRKRFFVGLFVLCSVVFIQAQQVAFPGAEGFGAYTTGGRGGEVYEVTNLNNAGSGSLRDAVSKSNRTVVFRVSGYIKLTSTLDITGSNITIAGQTAPGEGICVRDYPTKISGNNIIIRFLRFRLGDVYNLSSDAFNINDQKNIILDHCSISWGGDECASWYGNENVTIQWCMIGEGLNYKGHSMGGLWGGNSTYHHNLIYSCGSRHPKFAYTYDDDITDHRNNVVYNWGYESAYCSPTGRVNIVNNYYKSGPSTNTSVKDRIVYSEYDTKRLYVDGNFVEGYPDISADNWSGGVDGRPIKHDSPFSAMPVTNHTAEESFDLVLDYAGASLNRDSVDLRVIDGARNGYGQIPNRPSDVGGYPLLADGVAPLDTDQDGMPDDYEDANGLNKNDPEDRNGDPDGDGFTHLEDYLNSLIPQEFGQLSEDTELPAAPSNLTASTFSGDRVDLTWDDNANNERGYVIRYSKDGWQSYQEVQQALANIIDYSVTGLDGSTRYEFKVAAYNTLGNSGFSAVASDSTIAANHYLIWTNVEGPGHIELSPEGGVYEAGTEVTVTAVADGGYVFDTWLDDFQGTENPKTITINTSYYVTARFDFKAIEVPLLYDFGPGSLAPGYTRVEKSTPAYSASTGYGFESTSGLDQRNRSNPDDLREDFIVANSPQVFMVDLPNGTYGVNFIAGDNMSNAPNGPMDVYAEGVKKISKLQSEGGAFDEEDFTVDINDGQLTLRMVHSDKNDGTWRINALEITAPVGVGEQTMNAPGSFALMPNYPNPFNPSTEIRFQISESGPVRLTVYDLMGREVDLLADDTMNVGSHYVSWNPAQSSQGALPSGIYYAKLESAAQSAMIKMLYVK